MSHSKAALADVADVAAVQAAWGTLQGKLGPLGAITSQREYERKRRLLNALLDQVGSDERHPLAGLLDLLGDLVAAFEARHVPLPDAPPAEVLRLLMDSHGLTQADLAAELGGQSVTSAVLAGRRSINVRQAKALSQRFGISAAAFI
jgi:HTH-type transcriptional regulator/antitoxin HigA